MSDYRVVGSCLCGSVQYEITGHLGIFQYCYCSRCRKFTGGAFSANMFVAPDQFRWTKGEVHVARFALPEAKHFATAFCRCCGSSLPWQAQTGKAVVVPAGTLDADPELRPSQSIFCASRAVWFTDPDSLPAYDEMPSRKKRKG
ncbi:MAG: GFA family protein [Oceanospirillales bacterium]|nr:GFA family protein [Oceanospirillales bacterium]